MGYDPGSEVPAMRSRPMRYRFRFWRDGIEIGTDLMPTMAGAKRLARDIPEGAYFTIHCVATGRLLRAYGLLNGEPLRLGPH